MEQNFFDENDDNAENVDFFEDKVILEELRKIENKKKGFFSKILSVFRKEEELNSNNSLKEYSRDYSKFREYLFLLDETEDEEKVNLAIDLCDDSLKLARHRAYIDKKRKECQLITEDLNCYANLSDEDAKHLKNLIGKFTQLNNERNGLRYQLGDFNNSINKLEALQEDAYDAICQIEEAESEKKILSRDIEIIRAEKERTEIDRERLQFAYNVLYKFSFIISLILGISIIILTLIYMSMEQNVFLPLSILCFTLIFTIALIYAFRKKIVFELRLNEKKQSKLVSLLNKKTVVYSYYINFLNYEYKKYSIKNSRTLKSNLEDYENYKNIVSRYDGIGKILFEVQKQLEEFLESKNIDISNISLNSFSKSINIDNKKAYFREIDNKRKKLEVRIAEIDKEQEKLLEKLVKLNVEDTSKEKVVEKIIKAYMNETEKIVLEIDKNIENGETED